MGEGRYHECYSVNCLQQQQLRVTHEQSRGGQQLNRNISALLQSMFGLNVVKCSLFVQYRLFGKSVVP